MSIHLSFYSKTDWEQVAEYAHKSVFNEKRPKWSEKYDFAILASRDEVPLGFATCREIDDDNLYLQFGGCFDAFRGFLAVKTFTTFIEYLKPKYKRISTLVKNDNINYLHLIMKFGFRASGIRFFEKEIYLEMSFCGASDEF